MNESISDEKGHTDDGGITGNGVTIQWEVRFPAVQRGEIVDRRGVGRAGAQIERREEPRSQSSVLKQQQAATVSHRRQGEEGLLLVYCLSLFVFSLLMKFKVSFLFRFFLFRKRENCRFGLSQSVTVNYWTNQDNVRHPCYLFLSSQKRSLTSFTYTFAGG